MTRVHAETNGAITSAETVNELVARLPQVLPVLQRFGIDTCCGGALPLPTVAEHHTLDLQALLAALNDAVRSAS